MIPGLGRSPGEGKGYPLQYSGLENSIGSIVLGVTKNQTRLNDFHFTLVVEGTQSPELMVSCFLSDHMIPSMPYAPL